jgi:hypothetical protein
MSSERRSLPESPRARWGVSRAEMRCDPYWNHPSVSAPIGSVNNVSASMTGPRVSWFARERFALAQAIHRRDPGLETGGLSGECRS